MTRGLGESLLPYRVRDFHSLFLASFPGARPDPDSPISKRRGLISLERNPRLRFTIAVP